MKKFLKFLIFFLPWFLSSLFMQNTNFYKTLELPVFAPPPILFAIIWPILYLLIAISIYMISEKIDLKGNSRYRVILIINYIFNQLFTIFFFNLKSISLGLLSTVITLITGYLLFKETEKVDKKASYLLIPYLIWLAFASVLIISIAFMN